MSEADWTWVLLELADDVPVTKVPRSPQRLALQWQQFFDAIVEGRLTHDPDSVLARHAANLGLIWGPSGLRPDLDVAESAPIAGALACMVAFDGLARIEPAPEPMVVLPPWDRNEQRGGTGDRRGHETRPGRIKTRERKGK